MDLEKIAGDLRSELAETTSDLKQKKLMKRLKIVENFMESGNRPEWMIMKVVRSSRRTAPAGSARWRPFRDVGPERSLSPRYQP